MPGYQLIHVETYAKVSTKKGKPSMVSVVNEAMRVDGYCPHVYRPQKPEVLYGLNPLKLPEIAQKRAAQAKDKQGRKLRKDTPLLLAGVISIGVDSVVNFSDFVKLSIGFLRKKYGQNLMSAVLHLDEEHPHIHFYALPNLIDKQFTMAEIHDGIRARNECEGGYSKKAHAYKQAMRVYQDSYYNDVSSKLGLTRLGPKVQRLTRKQWKAQQKQAQVFSKQRVELNKQQRQITADKAALLGEKKEIALREAELTVIRGASFFQNKNEKRNLYLRKRLNKSQLQNSDVVTQLDEKQQSIIKMHRELRALKKANDSYQRKFDAMSYKLELKDQFIRQLKLKRDNYNEKKCTRSEQYTCQY